MSDQLHPIPGWPGYSVNRLGQIHGSRGPIKIDHKACVRLRHAKTRNYRTFFVGEIMELAGLMATLDATAPTREQWEDMAAQVDALRTDNERLVAEQIALARYRQKADEAFSRISTLQARLEKAEESLDRARRINAHFIKLTRATPKEVAAI